ncbi:MAG: hypothetical protein EA400_17515 [Chromatiaceae bacterium]|nr:MAG: hypothetical protein EA400_17515 [Chromatiaceae bacterium]
MDRNQFRYQPYYCEENAWWLCAEPALGPGPRQVIFVRNEFGHCPFEQQRAAAPGALLWWDYHCVVLDGVGRIWDLDSRLPLPLPLGDWLAASFPFIRQLERPLRPRFRLVPASEFQRDFASDRSHMRAADGTLRQPPPPWPALGVGMNLPNYLDLAQGIWLDLPEFTAGAMDPGADR